ncbi:MAG: hypothetical protein IPL46_33045 [Saprospiraceae bacterium]|nr:hypothetical protein [Saprospiraceae bacterium]
MRISVYFVLIILAFLWSCHSEIPFDPGPMDPDVIDTMLVNPVDTSMNTPQDSTGMPVDSSAIDSTLAPCDTSVIYFESDILPILIGNCANAGCHDPISAQHELVLTSYDALKLHDDVIVPFDLDKSELYEKITEDKVSDRMPPAPNEALTQDQIVKIGKWILQGAQNNSCNDGSNHSCDTAIISFANDVKPIFDTYCITCHGSSNANGGVSLISYNGASSVAKTGKLLGVVKWTDGFLMMPLGGNQIPDCDINTLSAWINQGVTNN